MKYEVPGWGIVLEAFRYGERLFETRVLWNSGATDFSSPLTGILLPSGCKEVQTVVLREDNVWFGSYEENEEESLLRKESAVREVISGSEWILVESDSIPLARSIIFLGSRIDVPCCSVEVAWAFNTLAEHPCFSLEYSIQNDRFSSVLKLSREHAMELARKMKPEAGDCNRVYPDKNTRGAVLFLEADFFGLLWGEETPKGTKLFASNGELIATVVSSRRLEVAQI
ncbi:hypothetical protein SH449x_000046 [Pirellulaceae bacterium SH449]